MINLGGGLNPPSFFYIFYSRDEGDIELSRSKFNINKDKEDRTCDGIVFDSKMEMHYYRDVLRPLVGSGTIANYELQKKYVLQNGFSHNGKNVNPITYVADFYIEYADGRVEVIDIKGYPDTVALLKRKLFWHTYPELDYKWLSYVKKYGGWVEFETLKQLRKQDKLKKKKEAEENGSEE